MAGNYSAVLLFNYCYSWVFSLKGDFWRLISLSVLVVERRYCRGEVLGGVTNLLFWQKMGWDLGVFNSSCGGLQVRLSLVRVTTFFFSFEIKERKSKGLD